LPKLKDAGDGGKLLLDKQMNDLFKSTKTIRNTDRAVMFSLVAGTVGFWIFYSWWRPDALADGGFLLKDFSQYIYTINALRHGEVLYRDVMWQYGPIPIYYAAGFSLFTGNNPLAYQAAISLIAGLNLAVIYRLLRRISSPTLVILSMTIFVIPWQLRQVAGGLIYFNFEFLLLSLIALSWAYPIRRTPSESFGIGLLLGGMQLVKFGGAFVFGAIFLALDIIILLKLKADKREVLRCFWSWSRVGSGFLLIEGIFVASCFILLPDEIARDTVWPSYMLQMYNIIGRDGYVFSWHTWGLALGTQLPMVACFLFSAFGFISTIKRTNRKEADGIQFGSVLFFLFFLLGSIIYFKHVWLVFQYACILTVPCAAIFLSIKIQWKAIVALSMMPAMFAFPYKVFLQSSGNEPHLMPNGETLWLDANEIQMTEKLFASIESMNSHRSDIRAEPRATLVVGWVGSGLFHYGKLKPLTRHTLYLKGFMRPYEEKKVFDSLDQTAFIVLFGSPSFIQSLTDNPDSWDVRRWSPFRAKFDGLLLDRLGPATIVDSHTALFPIVPSAN